LSETTKRHKSEVSGNLNFAVFVCSSSRYQQIQKGKKTGDVSGDLIEATLKNAGHNVLLRKIIPDREALIKKAIRSVIDSSSIDVGIFCGGTGITPRDITIETVAPFLDKTLPGFGEIFRQLSYEKIGSGVILSRALAGVTKGKLIFCIPGSPDAVKIAVETLILRESPHIVRHARE
jgi:molybdenum cofactor biosynthesis protein B